MWNVRELGPPLSAKEEKEFSQFMKDLVYGINQKRNKVWNQGDFLQHLILTFRKLEMKEEVVEYERHLRNWNRTNKQGETKWK